jgi:hypothetical protein
VITAVLDSGALSAWEGRERRVLAALEAVRRVGSHVVVSTVVVAGSTDRAARPGRGGEPLSEGLCPRPVRRAAGSSRRGTALRDGAGAVSVVDAVVAATGESVGARVLTGDPADLRQLAVASTRLDVIALNELP